MILKKTDVRKFLPQRAPNSHKGQNGRVLIIGGSLEYYGAPILAGLSALSGGADLVTLLVPECNFDVSRSFYPDFIVRSYGGNHLNVRVLEAATPLLQKADSVLIGPGITKTEEVITNVEKLLRRITVPVVLDADALPAILNLEYDPARPMIITPHFGEFSKLINEPLNAETSPEELMRLLTHYAEAWHAVIVLKGMRDLIVTHSGEVRMNETGNPGMTVGGTGDVLAGLIASLIAQKLDLIDAASLATFVSGAAGDTLAAQKGFGFTATDLAQEIAYTLKALT